MSLKAAVASAKMKTRKPDEDVSFSIAQDIQVRLESEEESPPMKPGDFLRASGFWGMCAREEILCGIHDIMRKGKTGYKTQMLFNMGHAIHDILREPIYDLLMGKWYCKWCHAMHGSDKSPILMPMKCGKCGKSEHLIYEEIYLRDETLKVHGHPDGIIAFGSDRSLLEIKTTNEHSYTSLSFSGPNRNYLRQCNIYMYLLKLDKTYLVYENRNDGDIREFVLKFDERFIDEVKEMSDAIQIGLKTGELPPRTECDKITCARAKRCPVSKQCFAR